MWYVVNDKGDRIVELFHHEPPQKELQELSNELRAELYIIEGEHTGLTADPEGGWGKSLSSRKSHYFDWSYRLSLCENAGPLFGLLQRGDDNSPNNCAVCKRKLAKRKIVEEAISKLEQKIEEGRKAT